MATEKILQQITEPASGNLSTYQFRCVNLASDGQVQLATSGAQVVGVLQNKPAAENRASKVAVYGVTKVEAQAASGEAITVGAALICSTIGKAIAASTGGTAYVWGRALEANASGATNVISALITHEGPASSA